MGSLDNSNSKIYKVACEILVSFYPKEELIERKQRLVDSIRENEMERNEDIPDWIINLLSCIRDLKVTNTWIDFERSSSDDTNVLDFIRGLSDVFSNEYENNEESWMLTFNAINFEVCISLEGSCYKVSEVGKTWE